MTSRALRIHKRIDDCRQRIPRAATSISNIYIHEYIYPIDKSIWQHLPLMSCRKEIRPTRQRDTRVCSRAQLLNVPKILLISWQTHGDKDTVSICHWPQTETGRPFKKTFFFLRPYLIQVLSGERKKSLSVSSRPKISGTHFSTIDQDTESLHYVLSTKRIGDMSVGLLSENPADKQVLHITQVASFKSARISILLDFEPKKGSLPLSLAPSLRVARS